MRSDFLEATCIMCKQVHPESEDCETFPSGNETMKELTWTPEKPTTPGWYWYDDEYYGPAPVYVAWIGFIKNPKARTLEVDQAVGEDADQPLLPVSELNGKWAGPIQIPLINLSITQG